VELVLAMQWRLRREREARARSPEGLRFHLFAASAEVMPTHNAWVRRQFARVLAERGVQLHASAKVAEVLDGRVVTSGGETVPVDEVVWVTQAGGASWLRDTGLAVDDDGFLIVDDHLCCLGDERVFAAGDIASMRSRPLEKAGVFAVRMGVPLADNLRRALRGEPLRAYRPQRHWLALISTGGRHAVASRGPIGFAGDWVWRWKDGIDRRFMRRFSAFPVMAEAPPAAPPAVALTDAESTQAISALAMRCGGCGAKVGATVLSRALSNLQPLQREDVVVGLDSPDDAAVVRVPPGKAMVHTVDFFRAFIDDPYRFGRIAANHALGDLFAMGAEPQTAAAIVTVPPGLESKVEDVLFQMMRGAVDVLDAAGCALVGGHTGEGAELALGFSLHGLLDDRPDAAMRKGGLVAGDALILTKPIGTGTLFAAHPRGLAKGRWIDAALVSMEQSSRDAARILREHGARGCTDVTGFGLLGHLVEMTRASGVDAELTLSALPVLDGAEDCVASGVTSSLQPANVRLRRALRNQAAYAAHPRYPLLFDPQTAGGLLAGVPADVAQDCIARLRESGYLHAAVIGRIAPPGDAMEPITLVD
jgi:selenide,water dikinase